MPDLSPVDLGHGVKARWLEDREGYRIGLIHEHPAADGSDGALGDGVCHGLMPLAGRMESDAVWAVTGGNVDVGEGFPGLTLEPSSLCRACGHHGWIREGRWVPA